MASHSVCNNSSVFVNGIGLISFRIRTEIPITRTLDPFKLHSANVLPPGKLRLGWFNPEEQMLVLLISLYQACLVSHSRDNTGDVAVGNLGVEMLNSACSFQAAQLQSWCDKSLACHASRRRGILENNSCDHLTPTPSLNPIGIRAPATALNPLSVASRLYCAAAFLVS